MNCTDCRDSFAAQAEHLLDPETAADYERHLAICGECREYAVRMEALRDRLAALADSGSTVSVAPRVLERIRVRPAAVASVARFARWWIGAASAAAAGLALVLVMLWPRDTKAQAIDVMTRAISAIGHNATVHVQGRMRTPPADNFSFLSLKADFTTIELWREFDGLKRWRVEKPGRIAWMDGKATRQFLRSSNSGVLVAAATRAAFDTGWLQSIADLEQTLASGLAMARTHGWKMELTPTTEADGSVHQLVTIDVPSAAPAGDYLQNKFLSTAATRRLYRFEDRTGQLEALQIYLRDGADFRLVFEITRIGYNESFADDLFSPALPNDVAWSEIPLPGAPAPTAVVDPRFAAMTPAQAARTLFEAFGRRDWVEAEVIWGRPLSDKLKAAFGGITVVQIGEPFTSAISNAQFVPYEIKLGNGATKKHNLALKKDPRTGYWRFDGGL